MPINEQVVKYTLSRTVAQVAPTGSNIDATDIDVPLVDLATALSATYQIARQMNLMSLPETGNQGEMVVVDNGDGTTTRWVYRGAEWVEGETVTTATGAISGAILGIPEATFTQAGLMSAADKLALFQLGAVPLFFDTLADLETDSSLTAALPVGSVVTVREHGGMNLQVVNDGVSHYTNSAGGAGQKSFRVTMPVARLQFFAGSNTAKLNTANRSDQAWNIVDLEGATVRYNGTFKAVIPFINGVIYDNEGQVVDSLYNADKLSDTFYDPAFDGDQTAWAVGSVERPQGLSYDGGAQVTVTEAPGATGERVAVLAGRQYLVQRVARSVDPTKAYRIACRYRVTSDPAVGSIRASIGYQCLDADGQHIDFVPVSNANQYFSQPQIAAADGWQSIEYVVSGEASSAASTSDATTFRQGTRFIRLVAIFNDGGDATTTSQVDTFSFDDETQLIELRSLIEDEKQARENETGSLAQQIVQVDGRASAGYRVNVKGEGAEAKLALFAANDGTEYVSSILFDAKDILIKGSVNGQVLGANSVTSRIVVQSSATGTDIDQTAHRQNTPRQILTGSIDLEDGQYLQILGFAQIATFITPEQWNVPGATAIVASVDEQAIVQLLISGPAGALAGFSAADLKRGVDLYGRYERSKEFAKGIFIGPLPAGTYTAAFEGYITSLDPPSGSENQEYTVSEATIVMEAYNAP